ncbi:RepB DNA-primase from phage plasmid [uncultured Caudovirales phage]|uniref:RepB DNA-primase from phage plasmid n=1 Tax=uncultured Caudovirales phage TaxID=2100421 RepID=A0A6J5SL22_9CAUD|nr:RepB DNA-primase from phage plasmid [uncultured Caudovirales phage]CAB4183945.1 RepB DNA-primase from phage plasmid [uncultured Caudovirales phage]CAB4199677.1 RepB DNA-primase from phage plasmid [uncultured Caudovirales phage]CAB4214534.1 RepB DNA-primase from phage plasmid [uncultured Caudovirales phage]
MNAVVQPIFTPKVELMRQHVEHLFGGYLDACHDGLIELAWTDTQADESGRHRLKSAKLYGTDQIDELLEDAARLNSQPMCNIYIGAALRKPETAPFGRAQDSDAYALTAAYVDLDDAGAATAAKEIYGKAKPTMIVVTGRAPHTRAQMWWRLDEPITDPAAWPALLRGMAAAMKADSTVTNPSRVMRLAGSIAWPVKDGRTTEVTDLAPLREPGQSVYAFGHLASLFPPVEGAAAAAPAQISHTTNGLGLSSKINDGREGYMVKTIAACLVEYIGTTGAAPSPQELNDAAWPQYERNVDFSRAGRGPTEFAEKCAYTVARFNRGEIRGIETLDKAIAVYREKAQARASTPRPTPAPLPQPARQDGAIKTTDFMTLLTEDVIEEPDYIEPGFAGPGTFVLIAGPPKAQKSFLLQEILVAAATGTNFLMDTFKCTRPLRVFYLQAEMNRKLLRKRAREFKLLSAADKRNLATNLIVSERFHMILNEGGVKTAVETIQTAFPDAPPDIIAIDPLANVFDQENENDNAQLMRFIQSRVEAVRQQINPSACVVMVHHATKKSADDMARDPFVAIRGAGALRGYYDSAIVIFRAGEESKTRKVHFELRSGESPEPMTVELENGRFRTVTATSSITKEVARGILNEVRAAWERNAPWSPYERSQVEGRYAVLNASKIFTVHPKAVKSLFDEWIFNKVVTFQERKQGVRPAGLQVTGRID